MQCQEQGRIRQGNGTYLFQKDWEDGHDPLKPNIETTDEKGNITERVPKSRVYNILDMKDDELGDFLGEDEMKALQVARQQRKESQGRDLCKEMAEKKQKEVETLQQLNQILELKVKDQEDKINRLEKNLEKVASLIAQLAK